MAIPQAVLNWSGGKDATLCLHHIREVGAPRVAALLTTASEQYGRSGQHGVRMDLVERQAQRLGLPLRTVYLPENPSMEAYDRCMKEALSPFVKRGVETALFGDIFLEDIRAYRERRLAEVGMKGEFPLWQQPTEKLARTFIEEGFRAVVVCVDEQQLGREFVGRPFDHTFLEALPDTVDPCGEHGEFHTFVYDGPLFSKPVAIERGEVVYRTYDAHDPDQSSPCPSDEKGPVEFGHWYCDLLPASKRSQSQAES